MTMQYLFKVTLAGIGESAEEAWNDAIEAFTLDPGLPDENDYEVRPEWKVDMEMVIRKTYYVYASTEDQAREQSHAICSALEDGAEERYSEEIQSISLVSENNSKHRS